MTTPASAVPQGCREPVTTHWRANPECPTCHGAGTLVTPLGANAICHDCDWYTPGSRLPSGWMTVPHRRLPVRYRGSHSGLHRPEAEVVVGCCVWCGLPLPGGRARRWHHDCAREFNVMSGNRGAQLMALMPEGVAHYVDHVFRCARCECALSHGDVELDHIVALVLAPSRDPRWWSVYNLQALCHECHRDKTAADRAEARRRRGAVCKERQAPKRARGR